MRLVAALILTLFVGVGSLAPRPAHALGPNVKSVIVAGSYGMLAGTALGLATFPLSQDARTIFIGTSVGLYLGIAVGIYYILHRDDPQNPLRSQQGQEIPPQLAAESRAGELRAYTFHEMQGPQLPWGGMRPEVRLATIRF